MAAALHVVGEKWALLVVRELREARRGELHAQVHSPGWTVEGPAAG